MRTRLAAALLCLAPIPASASADFFSFSGDADGVHYFVQVLGYAEPQEIMFETSQRRDWKRPPASAYSKIAGDAERRTLEIVHVNSGDPDTPPSYRLRARGKDATLTIGAKVVRGQTWWSSDP